MTPATDYSSALRANAIERPDETAFASETGSITHGALDADASRIAAALAADGCRPGDRLALLLPAGVPFQRAFAGAMRAAAVPFALPADLHAPSAVRRARLGRPHALVVTATRAAEFEAAAAGSGLSILVLERLLESSRSSEVGDRPAVRDPETPLFLQFTSGTTGEPKLVVLSHRALAAWRGTASWLEPRREDVLVGWVPPWHIMGLVRFVFLPVMTGMTAHLVEPQARKLGNWLETLERVRGTRTSAPDFALRTSVRLTGDRALDLSSLRLVLTGGEPVRRTTIEAFERRFEVPGVVRPSYGLAEATLSVTASAPGQPLVTDAAGNVSCGQPLPGIELRVVDERGDEAIAGRAGEIFVRGRTLFSGYFDDPPGESHLTAEGWLPTGDWGSMDPDAGLFVIGRRRNLIKHGGATHAPRELEEAAESVPGIGSSAAIALRRVDRAEPGPVLVAERLGDTGERAEREDRPEELARAVAESVRRETGLLPGEVLIVESGTLPRTAAGKLRHAELRRLLVEGGLERTRVLSGRLDGWSE